MVLSLKRYSIFLASSFIFSSLHAGPPVWTMTVASGNNKLKLPENITATIRYKVHNNSSKPKNLSLRPTAGLVQTNSCHLQPRGSHGDNCIVNFKIIGHLLPSAGLHEGPILCQANSDGGANPNQCYQPDKNNILSINKTKALEDWNNWGQNIQNNHHNANAGISTENVEQIAKLCEIDYTQGLAPIPANSAHFSNSAKPVIVNDTIYWTGFAGVIGAHQIQRDEFGNFIGCNQLWVKNVSNELGLVLPFGYLPSVRSSPAYYERAPGQGTLLYTAIDSPFSLPPPLWFTTPPLAFALDAKTGTKIWQIDLVDQSEVAVGGDAVVPSTTASPRIYKNTAFLGFSSFNNAFDSLPMTFRGHMIALNLGGQGLSPDKPTIKWTQYSIPPRPTNDPNYPPGSWFAGGGIWASAPSILPEKGLVIYGSGQLYNYPKFAADCLKTPESITTPSFSTTQRGETGGGSAQCLREAEKKLKKLGIKEPLASNSIIALNMKDGSYAWHVPTQGLDNWRASCGLNIDQPCTVPVPGPDWDVSGNSPIVAHLKSLGHVVISHNKGGSIFWINATNGKLIRRADVCVGSALGGTHWGISYDPQSETIYVPCSAGGIAPNFGGTVNFMSVLANGRKTCMSGYLNAIDANTGKLKWQTLPASSEIVDVNSQGCPDQRYSVDERFKYGIDFEVVIKNNQFNVPVNVMPNSNSIPLANQQKARSNGIPAVSNGIVYWPVYYGTVYALNAKTGAYLREMDCDQGAMYAAGPSVAKGLVMFGCGYGQVNPEDVGKNIMIYGLPNIITNQSHKVG